MKYEHPSLLEIRRLPYFSRIAALGSHLELKVTLPEVAELMITSLVMLEPCSSKWQSQDG